MFDPRALPSTPDWDTEIEPTPPAQESPALTHAVDIHTTLVGYAFYAYNDFAYLDRDGAGNNEFVALASQAISPPFTAPFVYSLSLKVTGTNPVHIVAQVKDANGNVKVNLDVNDASAGRITTPGGVGFGSGDADGALFDNFKRTTL